MGNNGHREDEKHVKTTPVSRVYALLQLSPDTETTADHCFPEGKTDDLPNAVVRASSQDVEDDVDVFDIPIGVTPLNIPAAGMTIFENKAFGSVRTIMEGNDPWFVGKDVCDCLGLTNTTRAFSNLDDDEKNTITISKGTPGNPESTVISESGLYSLILRSRKKEAKEFKRWVTHEILPTIRKTGGVYMTDEVMEAVVTDPDFMIGILQNLKKIKQERDEANQKTPGRLIETLSRKTDTTILGRPWIAPYRPHTAN